MNICYVINHTDGSFGLLKRYDLKPEVVAWLNEIAGDRWRYSWDSFDDPKLVFNDEGDFLAFKLRWL